MKITGLKEFLCPESLGYLTVLKMNSCSCLPIPWFTLSFPVHNWWSCGEVLGMEKFRWVGRGDRPSLEEVCNYRLNIRLFIVSKAHLPLHPSPSIYVCIYLYLCLSLSHVTVSLCVSVGLCLYVSISLCLYLPLLLSLCLLYECFLLPISMVLKWNTLIFMCFWIQVLATTQGLRKRNS